MSGNALSVLFESAPGAVFDRGSLERACGMDITVLLGSGFVREAARATEVVCADCDAPHWVAVRRCEGRGLYGRFCADGAGWAPVEPEALRRFAFAHAQFVAAVSSTLGATRAPDELIGNACWRIGSTKIGQADIAVVLAREMNDPRRLMDVATELKRRVSAGLGLILCGADPPVDLGVFPRGFRVVSLSDIICLNAHGDLVADLKALERALELIKRRRGEHGAPVDHPRLSTYIEARLNSGEAHPSDTAEARHLLDDPAPWADPGRPMPALDALRMSIRRRRNNSA